MGFADKNFKAKKKSNYIFIGTDFYDLKTCVFFNTPNLGAE